MASYNRVIMLGNLTRDPELRYTPSGTAVTEIGLAVNERRKNANGEWVEEVNFFDVTLWGRTAEVVSEYCGKGSPLFVEGRLKQDKWQDKNTGENRYKLKIIGDRIQLLGSKGGGGGGGPRPSGGGRTASYDDGDFGAPADYGEPSGSPSAGNRPPDDDIPF